LDDINIAFVKCKSRMPENLKVHSIELIGGASRMPIFRTMIERVFGVEASKTLNQSEALALGTAIYGAK
jgi:heat shock protein 4